VTTYHARGEWTSTGASGDALPGTLLRGVAVHWPGTSQDVIGDPGKDKIAERLRHYRDYHVNDRGWRDIGYNVAIDQAGRVWMLRSTQWKGNMVGAHCASPANRDANREYVGVLLLLGDEEPLSSAMVAAFRDWYRNRFLPAYPGRTDVRPHGEVSGAETACAGPFVRARISDLAGVPAPTPTPAPVWDGVSFPGRDAFRTGKSHPAVTTLDKRLIAHGFVWYHDGDGYQAGPTFTSYTRKNVQAFQFSQGWVGSSADGYPGPETWKRLMAPAAYRPPAFPRGIGPGKRVPCAITLQRALQKAGYMPASVAVNCNYGPQTQKAVARFHNANTRFRSRGVSWDIRIGPLGWNHLFAEAYGGAR
jgi:peptidoglycan hydrolase-like protein with peptidoglycan-binding domain